MGAGTPIPHNLRASYDSARAHLSAELEPPTNPIHPPIASTVAARDD